MPESKERLVAAWAGVALTVIAVLGFFAAPGMLLLWTVLLVFGIATMPQVLLWRFRADNRAPDERRRPDAP